MTSHTRPALLKKRARRSKRKSGPGPGRPTREQAEQRNLELLDKALDLFLENGFERTTIEAIAASMGMAKRTVYSLYGDKLTLFKASLQRAIDDWIVPVEALQAAETGDLEETLLQIGNLLVANVLSPEGLRLLRITNAESNRFPEIGAYTFERGTGRTLAYLADLFRRRLPPNGAGTTDFEEAAVAFLYLVVGGPATMTAWGVTMDDAEIDKHTSYCVKLFLYGLLPADARRNREK